MKKTKIKKDLSNKIKEAGSGSKIRGITLISLVITIVILIILATVVISLSLGNNGILNRARTATEQYQNVQSQEEIDVAKVTNEIDSYVDGNRDVVSKEDYDRLQLAYNTLLQNKVEFLGLYTSTTFVSRTSSSSVTIPNVEPGEYVIVGFKTFSEGGSNEFHLHTGDEVTSITNATYSSIGSNKTVYKVTVLEQGDITINFPASHSNNNGNGGYSYVWLFK